MDITLLYVIKLKHRMEIIVFYEVEYNNVLICFHIDEYVDYLGLVIVS